ncbi:adenylate/guanylate cyclase domain-containing protein [Bythopirellula goksoeyrii]|uniref:Adenylate cyclase n=1 Tax=Bythopirellula goksoeyrii TaxID=1400387 RepID=A0A5B9QVM7_9BACT|nr:adenylate/guanylate cyclase domain-containing protein [Bythopirellula goksoeyrii]QEG37983.1 Adenylate cyclase [Bythopirellula goksoeyrii]
MQPFLQALGRRLKPILDVLLKVPDNVERYDYRMYLSMIIANYIALLLHLSWVFVFWWLDFPTLSLINVGSVIFWIFSITILYRWGAMLTAVILGSTEVLIHQFLAVYFLGWDYGFQYYLLVIVAFTFLMNFKNVMYIPVILFFVCLISFLGFYYQVQYWNLPHVKLGETAEMASGAREAFQIINVASAFAILAIMSFFYSDAAQKAEALLELERAKSELLLLNILPTSIAQRLKEDRSIIADYFESATVLFSDIVGFTALSERVPPKELVDHLNCLFSAFDDLAEKHGLEKIKTIGDAYMIAGGIPVQRAGHTKAVSAMALDMIEAVEACNRATGEPVSIRIGIHTGPAVAGVIGVKKFAYDVWGDTVNTASRLEMSSLPGKIQLSEQVAERLDGDFVVEERGEVEVKGKGTLKTYWLVGRNVNGVVSNLVGTDHSVPATAERNGDS